jgi:hypothetical protein
MSSFYALVSAPPRAADEKPEDYYDVVEVRAQGVSGPRIFEFPKNVVQGLPSLLEPPARFLRLDGGVYEFLVGHPVPDSLLATADERARLLFVLKRLGRQLSDEEAVRVAQKMGLADEVESTAKSMAKIAAPGDDASANSDRLSLWQYQADAEIRDQFPAAFQQGLTAAVFTMLVRSGAVARLMRLELDVPGWTSTLARMYWRRMMSTSA